MVRTTAVTAAAMVAALLAAMPARGQDLGSGIDEIFSWTEPDAPGCAVAVSHEGEVVANRAYGAAELEEGTPITPRTRFDIGSVQKQFVAAAVLLLAEEGRIALDDDIRTYFPELPDYGRPITPDHLMTHTSGIRDWTGLLQMSSESEDALTLILRQRGVNFEPGEEWSYSNSGFVLLKELVARVTGAPFSEYARRRLFDPLGMEHTAYVEDVREVEDRAMAYEKDGDGWRLDILVGDERGDGGALLSTARDLLRWNDGLSEGRLGPTVTRRLHEPTRLNNGRELTYARGLFLQDDPAGTIIWHTGSAASYKSSLVRIPEQRLSLAVLCNAGDDATASRFSGPIVDLFVPRDSAAEAEAREAERAAADVDPGDRAGLYFDERTGVALRVVERGGGLAFAGGPVLVPAGGDRLRTRGARLAFLSGGEFEVRFLADGMELTSGEGETRRYRRARPPSPTPAELDALAGRYESEELRAALDVARKGDVLTVRLNGSPAFPFEAVEEDAFQLSRMMARFRRDASGRVVGLEYTNPMLRGIAFARTGDVPPAPANAAGAAGRDGAADGAREEDAASAGPVGRPLSAVEGPAAAELGRYAGVYSLRMGPRTRTLRVYVEDGGLWGELEGQGASRLLPRGERTFVAEVDERIRLVFTPEDPARGVTMHVNGREAPGERTSP